MNVDPNKSYVIVGVHPNDYFHIYQDDLIGKVVKFSYARENRYADGYVFGEATFLEPFDNGKVIFENTVFYGLKVSEWTIL